VRSDDDDDGGGGGGGGGGGSVHQIQYAAAKKDPRHYHGERKSNLWIYALIGMTVDYGASDAF